MKTALLALLLAPCSYAQAQDHAHSLAAWADIMAETRLAVERCQGQTLDDQRLLAAKARLGIADVDYFAFRPMARARYDALTSKLKASSDVAAWCRIAWDRYGLSGTIVEGALTR